MWAINPTAIITNLSFLEKTIMPNAPLETFVNNIVNTFKIAYPIQSMRTLVSSLGGSIIVAEDNTSYRQGVIRKLGNSFQMYLPRDMSENYEKYTIARLLGYLFMGMGYRLSVEKWQTSEMYPPAKPLSPEALERLDYFAYAILMPRRLFLEKAQQYESDDMEREFNLMMKFFKVPREFIITRSVQLGLLDAE